MSSRALRRLQREEEERKQLEAMKAEGNQDADASEEDEEEIHPANQQKNAFDFLNTAEDDDEDEADEHRDQDDHETIEQTNADTIATSTKKSKKKTRKKKKKKTSKLVTPEPEPETGLDEIDQALASLSTKDGPEGRAPLGPDPGLRAFYDLLATDQRHLNPLNEMKKLFGSTVLQGERPDAAARRRGRGNQARDLGAALARGRGQGLAGLALRRNVFVLGKEDWPKATSGGLGMEIVEQEAEDFTIEYRFVHSKMYQGTQRQFDLAVESMDPQRMISHLQLNPYHISTLLQVSEIAKHQGDQAVAVDLLERALFTFGRSVHSTFANAMSHGKARLDFRRQENREFWLAAYRYIGALGQKGTWRTAFEWAKLLLSLDPEQDPYCIRLIIDQLAIRGAQFETLVKLAETPMSVIDCGQHLPSLQISLSMAYYKLKRINEAQDTLRKVASQHPWVVAELCKEINMEPIPPAVWGRQPRTQKEELLSVNYGLRAKDIWKTPEALSFLKSVLDSATRTEPSPVPSNAEDRDLNLAECRSVLLSETPALISILPREVTNMRTTSSDPLPPEDNLPSYGEATEERTREEWEEEIEQNRSEEATLTGWFRGLLRRVGIDLTTTQNEQDPAVVERIEAALANSNADLNEWASRTSRLEELRDRQQRAEQRLAELERGLQNVNYDGEAAQLQAIQAAWQSDDEDSEEGEGLDSNSRGPMGGYADHRSQVLGSPRQAFVEEAQDDDAPQPTAASSQTQQPLLRPTADPSEPLAPSGGYDDEANQRWLAGRGMLQLKDFIAQHGADENAWKDNLEIDITPATEYAHRITLLKQRASREFILNYALKQGAGAQASDLIRRLLA